MLYQYFIPSEFTTKIIAQHSRNQRDIHDGHESKPRKEPGEGSAVVSLVKWVFEPCIFV